MTLHIRPHVPGPDDNALWALLEPVFRAGETMAVETDIGRSDALEFWTGGPGRQVFLAEENGAVLGTSYIRPAQRGGGDHVANGGYITAAEATGRGIARALLDHSLETARRAGYRAMQFNYVVASNNRAVETWKRAGFRVIGRLPKAFRHPTLGLVDALVMHRTL